jgi:methyl-accepting chemotaxis protein
MKIGSLLTTVILSLSAVGGGLAAYVATTKHDTMDRIFEAQQRLEIVRAVGDIPRYFNSERGFATNILFGPAVVEQKQRSDLDNYRRQTDGAVEKMDQVKKTSVDALDDGQAIVARIGELKTQFDALRSAIDKAIDGPAEARRDAAKKIVADNAVFNTAVTTLLNEQVRRMAILNGDAYRQSNYANVAWTLRDIGGLNASLHKNLVGARRVATEAERMELSRSQGRTDQILIALMELRGNPSTPKNVEAALGGMQGAYVDRFGQELKLAKAGAASGQYEHDVDTYYAESQRGLAAVITVREAFYDNAGEILAAAYSNARFSFLIALAGLVAVVAVSAGLVVMVRRRVCRPIVDITASMSRLAAGDMEGEIPASDRQDEIGAMAAAVQVFKDNMIKAERLSAEQSANNDIKMRRARALDELTRSFESKVSELVTGLSSSSSMMEETARSMSSTADVTDRQAGVVASASRQTTSNVQTVASATEELTSSISEISRQVAQSAQISARAVDNARRTGDIAQSLAAGAQKIGDVVTLIQNIAAQTNLLALNATIEAAPPKSNRWPARPRRPPPRYPSRSPLFRAPATKRWSRSRTSSRSSPRSIRSAARLRPRSMNRVPQPGKSPATSSKPRTAPRMSPRTFPASSRPRPTQAPRRPRCWARPSICHGSRRSSPARSIVFSPTSGRRKPPLPRLACL